MIHFIVLFAILNVITADLFRNENECGISSEDKIIKGIYADIFDFPWTVRLQYEKGDKIGFLCNGVLINKRYVLTQAYCVQHLPGNWKLKGVRLGEFNTTSEMDCMGSINDLYCADPVVDISIEETIVHENASKSISTNDIALLRLSKDVNFTEFILPICLPTNKDEYFARRLILSGWGITYEQPFSDVKLQLHLQPIGIEDCKEQYKQKNITLGDGQLCVNGSNTFCAGSAGNPLMAIRKSDYRWVLVGTESFGTPCRNSIEDHLPSVNTDVTYYSDWIRSKLKA